MKTPAINTSALPFFRFFAASVVAFFHFGQKIEWYSRVPALFKAGSLMVTFFFVLSGFVLFLGYSQRDFHLRQYWMKRAIKILPLYYLAFLLAAGLWAYKGQLTLLEFFLNLFCLQSWFPHPLSLNFTSWFVSALLFFYCVFPFIQTFLRKTRPDGHLLLLAGFLLWAITQGGLTMLLNSDLYPGYPSWPADLIYYFPLSHFCSFFMGICGGYYLVTREIKVREGGLVSAWITVSLLSAVTLMVQFQSRLEQLAGVDLPFAASLYAPVMLLLLFHLTVTRNPLLKILSWPQFVIWGEMSYPLFILQAPLDTLYKYLVPGHDVMAPGGYFVLFTLFLLSTAFLATIAEKRVGKRIVRRLTANA